MFRRLLLPALFLAGCSSTPPPPPAVAPEPPSAPGIALSDTAQANLGITWATVEPRVVQGVLRLPGRFVADPSARRVLKAPLPGRLTVVVTPFQRVTAGQPLATLSAPAWQELRTQIAEAQALGGPTKRLEHLREQAAALHGATPHDDLPHLVIRAPLDGIVEDSLLGDGAWVDDGDAVATVTDTSAVRLEASILQSDLPTIEGRTAGRIVAADPASDLHLEADLHLAPVADAIDRTARLMARPRTTPPSWIRPGITALLEVVRTGSSSPELAIPVAATIRDGLKTLIFRRDPTDGGRVFAVEADLGASDGRYVAVLSGLKGGDQVVLGGIYPLKLSQSGQAKAGHFHADGTFHEGHD